MFLSGGRLTTFLDSDSQLYNVKSYCHFSGLYLNNRVNGQNVAYYHNLYLKDRAPLPGT